MYNEELRITQVLDVLQKIEGIDEIICVDDCSQDKTAHLVTTQFPDITLYRHKHNMGKSAAVATWLHHAKNTVVFLCDADLQWLKAAEIEDAIQAFFVTSARMIILKRIEAAIHIKAFRGHVLISGERILYKKDLEKILQQKKGGFALEVLLNKYMMDHAYPVYWMPSSAINTFKMAKYGLRKWLQKDRAMYQEMELFQNAFAQQILSFCRQKATPHKGIVAYLTDIMTLQK